MILIFFLPEKISHYQDPSEQRGYHTRPQGTSSASTTSTSWSSMTPGGQQFPQLSLCTPQPPAASAMQQQHKPSDFLRANHRGHKTASALPHTSKNNVLQQRLAVYYNCKSHPSCTTIHLTGTTLEGGGWGGFSPIPPEFGGSEKRTERETDISPQRIKILTWSLLWFWKNLAHKK